MVDTQRLLTTLADSAHTQGGWGYTTGQPGSIEPTCFALLALSRAPEAFADAIATITGSIFGTSTVVTYIESATGVSEGGRTGLTAVTVAALFVLAMFLAPVAGAIPPIATAPALIIVGALMIGAVTSIKWEDMTEAIPAFLTMLAMPLTFSIANGLALGFIFYPLLKVLTGRWREANPLVYVLAGLFVLRYAYLGIE